jgi:diacylglycerol kinase family enzyme
MRTKLTTNQGPDVLPRRRRSTAKLLAVTFAAGLVVGGYVMRRRVGALLTQTRDLVRRGAKVERPALIINRWSGDGKADRYGLVDVAERAGIKTIMLERGDNLVELARDAIDAGADAIGMAGGDGSLGLVADVAIERNVPFFCVPVGTRNHFALDLGIDRDDPLAALDALRDGEEILIDYARANGRVLLNNVSFGVYAQAVHRDEYRDEKLSTLKDVLSNAATDVASQAQLRYVTPDGQQHDRAPLLIVSNNRYRFSGPPDYGRRSRMDEGTLGIGAITELPERDPAATRLNEIRSMVEWEATSYRIESDEPILAGLDGEALVFESPLNISIQPQGLRVLVPAGTQPGYVSGSEAAAARLLDLAETMGVAKVADLASA